MGSEVWKVGAVWTERTRQRAKAAARFSSPICTLNAEARIWNQIMNTREILPEGVLGDEEHVYVCVCVCAYILCVCVCGTVFHALWLIEVLVIYFCSLHCLHTYLSVCLPVCLSLSLCIFLDCLPGLIVASLASMAQASTLKKCKASHQSGLERQYTQKPQCEPLFFFFATLTPARPALSLPAGCGRRYLYVWSHLTESRTAHTCPRAFWEWLISSCAQQYDRCVYSRLHWRPGLHWCFNRHF